MLAACGGNDDKSSPNAGPEASPSKSLYTLTPIPLPPNRRRPASCSPTCEQSSRDAAANRFQVWIDNDTDETITPTKVTYTDGRFRTDLPGTRLRDIPSQSERGFPIYQPERPACASDGDERQVTVEYVDGEQSHRPGRGRDRRDRPLHLGALSRDRDRRGRAR